MSVANQLQQYVRAYMRIKIKCFKIENNDLPKATDEMNCNYTDAGFRCTVKDIIILDENSIIVAEIEGYYPFITNQWKFIKEGKP